MFLEEKAKEISFLPIINSRKHCTNKIEFYSNNVCSFEQKQLKFLEGLISSFFQKFYKILLKKI